MNKSKKIVVSPKPFDAERLRQVSAQGKTKVDERLSKACDEAFKAIVANAGKKMDADADVGRTRSYLYEWEYVEDPKDKRFTYGGFRMRDLLSPTRTDLLAKLRQHFNPEGDANGLYVGWHAFKNEGKGRGTPVRRPSRYGIFVSWIKFEGKKPNTEDAPEDALEDAPEDALEDAPEEDTTNEN